jgi:hypothetical protein
MRRFLMRATLLLALCAIGLAARASSGNLVTNGSFEAPQIAAGTTATYAAGSTAIMGWTVVGIDSSLIDGGFTQSGITFQPQHGEQWIDLAAHSSNSKTSGVTQSIATTVGQRYAINFFVGSATDNFFFYPATVDLSISGGPRTSHTNPTAPNNMLNWRLFTVNFTATNSNTNITFFNGGDSNNFLSALDNVSVEPVDFFDADFNEDGKVDADDLTVWTAGFGVVGTAVHTTGDADQDQNVDGGDFLVWQRELGLGVLAAAVPEPVSSSLVMFVVAAFAVLRRSR